MNTALDNPTNFFTAQSLDCRAGDINNLLDGIGNGVQVLQAANTGITSLQKLVDTAKSIANQALQTAVGYSTKSNVSATIAGATALDLRGTTSYTSATATSNVCSPTARPAAPRRSPSAFTLGGTSASLVGAAAADGAGTAAASWGLTLLGTGAPTATGHCGQRPADRWPDHDRQRQHHHLQIGFGPGGRRPPPGFGVSGNLVTDGNGNSTVYHRHDRTPLGTVPDLAKAIDLASGVHKALIAAGAATSRPPRAPTAPRRPAFLP